MELVPLDPTSHGDDLFEATCGSENERLWTYLPYGPFLDRPAFERALRVRAECRVVEVGDILYAPAFQRTRGATEAMYLLARHVFENLRYRRYEWKCDVRNEASRRAAVRFGFTFEGIFRQHMIVKDRNRDSAWFSMLDSEWPIRKAGFERWLEGGNFDSLGRQRTRLDVRADAQPSHDC